MINQLKNLESL